MDLITFIRGGIPDGLSARLREAVPAGYFSYPSGLAPLDRCAVTYERFRSAGRAVPAATELLADPPVLCALLERAAVADPALFHLMLLHYTLVLAPIVRADDEATAGVRRQLESMESFGVFAMTEGGRSNSHLAPGTTARFDDTTRSFILDTPDDAASKFPTSSGHPDFPKTAAVFAQLVVGGRERGVFIFAVPLRDGHGTLAQGVQITQATDMQQLAVDHAAVRFTGARVPFGAWLAMGAAIAADGSFTDPRAQQRAALTMATAPHVWRGIISACAATARASAAMLVRHCAGRVAMGGLAPGSLLLTQRSQQEAVITALGSACALTAIASHVKGSAQPAAQAAAAPAPAAWAPWSAIDRDLPLLKAAATALAEQTATLCRIRCGAPGYAATGRLNSYRSLAHAFISAGGDNQLIHLDTARALAGQDVPALQQELPVDGTASLAACASAARCLERRLARTLAGQTDGPDPATAWGAHHRLAVRAATAHADRVILEILAAGPARLQGLFRWYALDWYEQRAGELLDEGIAARPLADRVARTRETLCGELMPGVDEIVAAFELPELDEPYFWDAGPAS